MKIMVAMIMVMVMIVLIFALMMVIICKHCKNDDDGNDDLDASNNGNLWTKEVL